MKPFNKILIPFDFSAPSEHALETAADLCRRYEASATVLHVWEPELFSVPESFQLHDPTLLPESRRQLISLLDTARARLQAAGVLQVDTELTLGSPASEIIRFARDGAFDLIVMGTHGRRGLSHVLLGSVAEAVVRKTPCAVATVPLDARHAVAVDEPSSVTSA
jgi:nucleotide-binding universal stress UspA family protein